MDIINVTKYQDTNKIDVIFAIKTNGMIKLCRGRVFYNISKIFQPILTIGSVIYMVYYVSKAIDEIVVIVMVRGHIFSLFLIIKMVNFLSLSCCLKIKSRIKILDISLWLIDLIIMNFMMKRGRLFLKYLLPIKLI